MITNTMNIEEIGKEVYKDLPYIKGKVNGLYSQMRKIARKKPSKTHKQFVDYKSFRLNNWLLYFDYNKKDPTHLMLVTYITKEGYNAIMVNGGLIPSLTHYSGHFLERFNERFLKQEGLSKTEILKKYITRNTAAFLETSETDNRFFGRTNDGIVLGERTINDKCIWFSYKTFITPEMAHNGQNEVLDETTKLFADYWNNEWGKTKFHAFHPNVA